MTYAQAFRTSDNREPAVGLGSAAAIEGTRILLVSGNELRLQRLARSMKAAGGSVTAVSAGDEALALLRIGYRPGLLMMDGELPETDRLGLAGAVLRTVPPDAVGILTITGGP